MDWLRTFDHELSRRRRIFSENKDLYRKLSSINPKGLNSEDACDSHVWVPATHLMIHDAGARSYVIQGLKRRGFSEAKPYKKNGYSIVPQMCWKCDATREFCIEIITTADREKKLKALRPRKHRGRKVEREVPSVIDVLLS